MHVLGYFMLTTKELMNVQRFNPAYRYEKVTASLQKAQAFTLKHIAPMTDPNTGNSKSKVATRGTPQHYVVKENLKRSFQLGLVLIGGDHIG